jgi:hypothetical protein
MPRPVVNLGSNRPLLWLRPGIESWTKRRSFSDSARSDDGGAFSPPSVKGDRSSWYGTELDSEHIWYRGFGVSLEDDVLRIDDPDVDEPPPLIVHAAWGSAVRKTRPAFPFDFEPSIVTGTQYCDRGAIRMPNSFLSADLRERRLLARGAWVGWDDRAPDLTDTLEVVFANDGIDELPSRVPVAQLLFDLRRRNIDPFVVAAARVLEPLIGDLQRAISELPAALGAELRDLRAQVDRVEDALRQHPTRPSHLRNVLIGALTAISTIILSIIATHLDEVVPWEALWRSTREAGRCLGLW